MIRLLLVLTLAGTLASVPSDVEAGDWRFALAGETGFGSSAGNTDDLLGRPKTLVFLLGLDASVTYFFVDFFGLGGGLSFAGAGAGVSGLNVEVNSEILLNQISIPLYASFHLFGLELDLGLDFDLSFAGSNANLAAAEAGLPAGSDLSTLVPIGVSGLVRLGYSLSLLGLVGIRPFLEVQWMLTDVLADSVLEERPWTFRIGLEVWLRIPGPTRGQAPEPAPENSDASPEAEREPEPSSVNETPAEPAPAPRSEPEEPDNPFMVTIP